MELMDSTAPAEFWKDFREQQGRRSSSAAFKDPEGQRSRVLTVDVASIHGVCESLEGWLPRDLPGKSDVDVLFKIADAVLKAFDIKAVTRAGLRTWYFGSKAPSTETALSATRAMLPPKLLESVENTAGAIGDYGFALDGEHADHVKYHLRFGPYRATEAKRYLTDLAAGLESKAGYTSIMDLDLYEQESQFPTRGLAHWSRPLFERVAKTASAIDTLLAAK